MFSCKGQASSLTNQPAIKKGGRYKGHLYTYCLLLAYIFLFFCRKRTCISVKRRKLKVNWLYNSKSTWPNSLTS